ncbi:MAG: radical SAM protein [Kiritimatiellae bacterium]|nr:radical SAM protein [Kiritimatiellia bacterium]
MPRWSPCDSNIPFMGALADKAAREKFSLSGMVSLTARCNLSCVHCYIKDSTQKYPEELATETFRRIFDEITDMGTLFLTITGGEPMVRSDFKELYSYARNRGLMLTLFTNATLVDDEIVALLKDLPPRYVDVSLYGATEETYESITGVKGSYQRCVDGIELLLKNDIKVHLKSVLMKPNIAEFAELKKMAAYYDVPYRIDSMVFGKFSGDKSPLDLRVSIESGVECEAQMDGFRDSIVKAMDGAGLLDSDMLYSCGAGRSTFYVTEKGMLQPCLMVTDIAADLKRCSFKEAWDQVSKKTTSLKAPADDKCKGCDLYAICGYCPPMGRYSASGEEEKEYFCDIGRARKALI